jgi:1-phosphofructokinase family hexose kinase
MILCVTPNVAIDRTLVVPAHTLGQVHRPTEMHVAAGGKGLNVARAIRVLGGEALCAGFLAGHSGQLVNDLVVQEGLSAQWTLLETGETRTCVMVVDPQAQQTTVINEAGPQVTSGDWAALRADVIDAAVGLDTICFCGSLPAGTSPEDFVMTLQALQEQRKQVWVDTSGPWLRAAAGLPGIGIKINDEEIGELGGQPVESPTQAADAAVQLWQDSQAPVVVTMGSKGAVYVQDDAHRWYAQPPQIEVFNAVGSGDSFAAGLLYVLEQGLSPDVALKWAVAAGAANAASKGGARFTRQAFDDILQDSSVSEI